MSWCSFRSSMWDSTGRFNFLSRALNQYFTACYLGFKDGDGNFYVVDEHAKRGWLPATCSRDRGDDLAASRATGEWFARFDPFGFSEVCGGRGCVFEAERRNHGGAIVRQSGVAADLCEHRSHQRLG